MNFWLEVFYSWRERVWSRRLRKANVDAITAECLRDIYRDKLAELRHAAPVGE